MASAQVMSPNRKVFMDQSGFEWIGPGGPIARAVCRPQLKWLLELLGEDESAMAVAYEEGETEEGNSYLHLLTGERFFSALNTHPGNEVRSWELAEIESVEVTRKRFALAAELTLTARETSWAGRTHTLRFSRGRKDADRFAGLLESLRSPSPLDSTGEIADKPTDGAS
ncbi:hypothetical protein [Nocardiopsis metallicus]|uniref:YokE-like PH domain-containing protein n=2 Tax=Nocardiopsis metallicus TaxID=179819 RepID=A0A840W2P6_9ACTN|nr:hypothetical protein [Nocardiopsis metallicus]MBB5489563.1 hypothetical protein [Nocardiopsis metallicus]